MITKILCVTDGRPGNQRPAMLLAAEIAQNFQAEWSHVSVPKTPWRSLGNFLESWLLGVTKQQHQPLVTQLKSVSHDELLIITCGRTGLPYGRYLRRKYHAKLVHILNPYGGLKQFDAVVMPEHDRINGPNIVNYQVGLTTQPKADSAARTFMQKFPEGPKLALVVGGTNANQHISPQNIAAWRTAVKSLLPDLAGIAITFSRRTQNETKQLVLEAFSDHLSCFYDGQGPNPYPGFLSLCSHAAVSTDSMNMVADVAASKCAMMLLPVTGSQPKFQPVLHKLVAQGRADHLAFGRNIAPWDELPKVAQMVTSLLLGKHAHDQHENDGGVPPFGDPV